MAFLDVLLIVAVPAIIAAAAYVCLIWILLPIYRAHHNRYAQYLPLSTISERTHNFRTRVQRTVMRWILPRHLQYRFDLQNNGYDIYDRRGSGSDDEEGDLFGEDDGERMVGFDVARREREGRIDIRGGEGRGMDSERRLSRELEAGFRDSSDEDDEVMADVGR